MGQQNDAAANAQGRRRFTVGPWVVLLLALLRPADVSALGPLPLRDGPRCLDALTATGRCTGPAWHPVNIFNAAGDDPREAVDRAREPALRPIGRLDGSTAFLVSPCYALAAYHGVFGSKPPPDEPPAVQLSLRLRPEAGLFESLPATPAMWGDGYEQQAIREDWVLLRVDACPGKQIGWMELADPDDADLVGSPVSIAGYPNDKPKNELWRDRTGHVEGVNPGLFCGCLLNSAGTAGGNSGSPLYRETDAGPVVVGLQVRVRAYTDKILPAYDEKHANLAVDARPIHARIKELLEADKEAFWLETPELHARNPVHRN